MTKSEARELFELDENFDKEDLRLIYHKKYIGVYRKKSAAVTLDQVKECDEEIQGLNIAFCTLDSSEIKNSDELQLDFRNRDFEERFSSSKSRRSIENFNVHIHNLLQHNRYGLALSLLEIGIFLSLKKDSEVSMASISRSINSMGKLLTELGLIHQGIRYQNFNQSDYEKGRNFKRIGEYRLAAHHFALELRNKDTRFPIDDLCQHISLCYFLLNDYENAISIIEEVLPKLMPKKNIFEESCKWKDFATTLMISMYRMNVVKGKQFDMIKIRVKYPLSSKYLNNCFGSLDAAWKVVEKLEKNHDEFDLFMKGIVPEPFVKKNVDLEYSIEELEENYFDLFEIPMNKSLIYNPK